VHPEPLTPYLLRISSAGPIVSGGESCSVSGRCFEVLVGSFWKPFSVVLSHFLQTPHSIFVEKTVLKYTAVVRVEGLNGKALEEAGK
jgi:hypothetical protein